MSTNDPWTGGYVSEIPYTFGFYRELTPSIMNFAVALKGYALPGTATGAFNYCELGCGQGVSSALLAAAHPRAQFFATDFNPTHASHGRRLAAAAGLSNIHFFEDSFEELLERDLPEMDVIALHGVYSWISPEARRSIVEFARRRLKVGGFLYISYNALPGWAPVLPLRELMVAHAAGAPGPIEARIEAAIAFANRLEASGANYFKANPTMKTRLERIATMPRNYLAHEYFNRDWHPMYFSDIARELGAAKLTFVGSAHLTDHVDAVNISTEQIQMLAEIRDPIQRESLFDFMTNQQFRRDIFVRGPLRLSIPEQLAQLHDMRFTLTQAAADTPRTITGMSGEATVQAEIYDPIIAALGAGPMNLRQLMAQPGVNALDIPRLLQALTILVGGSSLQPSSDNGEAADAARKPSIDAFNKAVMERSRFTGDLAFLASPITSGGVQVDRFDQMFMLGKLSNRDDAPEFVWEILREQNQRLVRDGATIESTEDNLRELNEKFTLFSNKRLPVLKLLGMV